MMRTYPLEISTRDGAVVEPHTIGGDGLAGVEAVEFRVEHAGRVGSIQRGAVVLVEPICAIRGDGLYLVRLSGSEMLRRLQRLSQWRYRLSCDDPKYAPVDVDGPDAGSFEVLGRLLEVLTYGPRLAKRKALVS